MKEPRWPEGMYPRADVPVYEQHSLPHPSPEKVLSPLEASRKELSEAAKQLLAGHSQSPEQFSASLVALAWHNFFKRQHNNAHVKRVHETLVGKRVAKGEAASDVDRFSDDEEARRIVRIFLKEMQDAHVSETESVKRPHRVELLYGDISEEQREKYIQQSADEAWAWINALVHPGAALQPSHLTHGEFLPITNETRNTSELQARREHLYDEVRLKIRAIQSLLRTQEGVVRAAYYSRTGDLKELGEIEKTIEQHQLEMLPQNQTGTAFERKNKLVTVVHFLERASYRLGLLQKMVEKKRYKEAGDSDNGPPLPPAFQG